MAGHLISQINNTFRPNWSLNWPEEYQHWNNIIYYIIIYIILYILNILHSLYILDLVHMYRDLDTWYNQW